MQDLSALYLLLLTFCLLTKNKFKTSTVLSDEFKLIKKPEK